jgi:PTS system nitrogen regulatory IIA component
MSLTSSPAEPPSAPTVKPGRKMDIRDVIQPQTIVFRLEASTKADLLRVLAKEASAAVALPEKIILHALSAREELGSTGIGQGIALPHARLVGLAKPFTLAGRMREPIAFESIDGVPADIVVLLLIPDRGGEPHVDRLACVAKQLRSKAVQAAIRQANNAAQLYAAFILDTAPE